MYVCICNAITEDELRSAVAEGASSLGELMRTTGAGTCCGSCTDEAERLLEESRRNRIHPVSLPMAVQSA